MRHLILLTFLGLSPVSLAAVSAGEYFIDQDPGFGQATHLVVPAGDTFTSQINLSPTILNNLLPGKHLLGVRFQNQDGDWGQTDYRPFLVPVSGTELVTAEYFIDADPGAGNGTPFPLTDDSAQLTLDPQALAGLPNGGHFLGIRIRDNAGQWNPPNYRFFTTPVAGDKAVSEFQWRLWQDEVEIMAGSWTVAAGSTVTSGRQLTAPTAQAGEMVALEIIPIGSNGTPGVPALLEIDYQSFREDFLRQNFTETERNQAAISGDDADPDLDGLDNRFERAIGSNPRQNDPSGIIQMTQTGAFLKFPIASGATLPGTNDLVQIGALKGVLMVSPDLKTWTSALPGQDYGTPQIQEGSGLLQENIEVPLIRGSNTLRFYQLMIQENQAQ